MDTNDMTEEERRTRFFRLKFGKYNGKTLNQVAATNIGYIVWMLEHIDPGATRSVLERFAALPDIRKKIDKHMQQQRERNEIR
jgi:hypothetical protein